jgi:O-antigen ligase
MRNIDASVPFRVVPRFLTACALGALFAVCVNAVWTLEGRWFVVTLAGLALVSISMMFAGRFSSALFILLLFCVPIAGLKKYFFLVEDYVTWTNALSLGIIDILVAGLYVSWLIRVLVLRTVPMPRLQAADIWAALVLLSILLSLSGAEEPWLVLFGFKDLLVHVLVYFYVSRHLKPQHAPWLLAAIGFAILAESTLAVVQSRFGILVGLMLDRGAGGELLDEQLYRVPGIENVERAAGTTYDSHSLGVYMAMLAPFVLVYLYSGRTRGTIRAGSGLLLLVALTGLTFSYSRSAWLSCAITLALGILVLLHWRERNIVPSLAFGGVALMAAGPWLLQKVFSRLIDAPPELLRARLEQFPVALSIWRENVLFGVGAGNYVGQLTTHNLNWAFDIIVHNVPLYIGAELGVFGLLAYYGLAGAAMLRLWRVVRRRDEPDSRLALASLIALLAYLLDGMTDPIFREPVPYLFFWILIGISVALANWPGGVAPQHQQPKNP